MQDNRGAMAMLLFAFLAGLVSLTQADELCGGTWCAGDDAFCCGFNSEECCASRFDMIWYTVLAIVAISVGLLIVCVCCCCRCCARRRPTHPGIANPGYVTPAPTQPLRQPSAPPAQAGVVAGGGGGYVQPPSYGAAVAVGRGGYTPIAPSPAVYVTPTPSAPPQPPAYRESDKPPAYSAYMQQQQPQPR